MTDEPGITVTTPLRLADAVKIAFPMGGITVAGLRRERDAGRLTVVRIAGKEFVTLAAIDAMIEACTCRAAPKVRPSTSAKGRAHKRSGASGTAPASSAQDALNATLNKLSESLAATSQKSTTRREWNVATFNAPNGSRPDMRLKKV